MPWGLETWHGSKSSAASSRGPSSICSRFKTWWRPTSLVPRRGSIGGGPGQSGRPLLTSIHHHLQRQLRGPSADDAFWRRPGPGLPAAGSGLRPRAVKYGIRRVLHHRRRIQPGSVRGVPRPGLSRQRNHLRSRPPGEVQPVDTTRPEYLPPVGNGPPPATAESPAAACIGYI